jgi:chromosomal replication initiator protein
MYLAKKHTDISVSKIGHLIGNRDHATVIHACKNINNLIAVDKDLSAEISEIEASFKQK